MADPPLAETLLGTCDAGTPSIRSQTQRDGEFTVGVDSHAGMKFACSKVSRRHPDESMRTAAPVEMLTFEWVVQRNRLDLPSAEHSHILQASCASMLGIWRVLGRPPQLAAPKISQVGPAMDAGRAAVRTSGRAVFAP